MNFRSIAIAASALLLAVAPFVTAAVPGLISYQGRLTNAAGNPVPDGAYFIRFQIYDVPVGGTPRWNSNIQIVQVKGGLYNYVLGQDVAFPNGLFSGGDLWLGTTVGADPEMTPRKQMIATSYAFVSQNADSVNWNGIKNIPAGFADGVDDNSGGDITAVSTSGGLSGGAASGAVNLSIANDGVTSAHIGDGQIVNADINAAAGISPAKVAGSAATLSGTQTFTGKNSFADSVSFSDSTMFLGNGKVKIGSASQPSFENVLTVARNYLSNDAYSRGGILVDVENGGTAHLNGGIFMVRGSTGNILGIGAQVSTDGYYRIGAYTEAQPITSGLGTGQTYGLQSVATGGAQCFGAHGTANSGITSSGIYGTAHYASQEGVGVNGLASNNPVNGLGVYGGATSNGWGVGVYGEAWANSTANWAGYFGGDVNVTGLLFSPAKANRIDHPLDPENRYLQSSDVQSPEMINVYSGNATTDNNGDAEVVLPEYFMAVNSDFRYQLTVVGQFAQAIVVSEIRDNRFAIKTDKPTVKVSWQVTGIRQDQFAQAHRVEPEAAKQPFEIGKYLHPELFGLGEERGMKAEIRAEAMKLEAAEREHPQKRNAAGKK